MKQAAAAAGSGGARRVPEGSARGSADILGILERQLRELEAQLESMSKAEAQLLGESPVNQAQLAETQAQKRALEEKRDEVTRLIETTRAGVESEHQRVIRAQQVTLEKMFVATILAPDLNPGKLRAMLDMIREYFAPGPASMPVLAAAAAGGGGGGGDGGAGGSAGETKLGAPLDVETAARPLKVAHPAVAEFLNRPLFALTAVEGFCLSRTAQCFGLTALHLLGLRRMQLKGTPAVTVIEPMFDQLLAEGADLLATTQVGQVTLYHIAAQNPDQTFLIWLLQKDEKKVGLYMPATDYGLLPVHVAAQCRNFLHVKIMAGLKPNLLTIPDRRGYLPESYAWRDDDKYYQICRLRKEYQEREARRRRPTAGASARVAPLEQVAQLAAGAQGGTGAGAGSSGPASAGRAGAGLFAGTAAGAAASSGSRLEGGAGEGAAVSGVRSEGGAGSGAATMSAGSGSGAGAGDAAAGLHPRR